MVNIYDKEHFKNARSVAYAIGNETKQSFLNCIMQLNRIKRNNNWDLYLFPDFVKHSFQFEFHKDGHSINSLKLNGGFILHGFEPTYSVELNPVNYPHWSIHT